MAYIPKTNIWASQNGKEIFYQDAPPNGIHSVLIASRGIIVNPFFVQKYGLKEQHTQAAIPAPMPDVETIAEVHHEASEQPVRVDAESLVETKVVEPENPEKSFKKKHKHQE